MPSITINSFLESANCLVSSVDNLMPLRFLASSTLMSSDAICFRLLDKSLSDAPCDSRTFNSLSYCSLRFFEFLAYISKPLSTSEVIPTKSVTLVTISPIALAILPRPGTNFSIVSLTLSKFAINKPSPIAKAPIPEAINAPLNVVNACKT